MILKGLQKLTLLDYPGKVAATVFTGGCNMRCPFCHNAPLVLTPNAVESISAEEFFAFLKKRQGILDGVCVTGGEPLLQADFVRELFELCKKEGIHTALDTSGCIWNDKIEKLLSVTDLCLLDYKMTNDKDYLHYTRCEKAAVEHFLSELQQRGIDTWLRQVIVKGINDTVDSVKRLYEVAGAHDCVKKVELLKFRKLCAPKYENLGIEFPFRNIPETSAADIQRLLDALNK